MKDLGLKQEIRDLSYVEKRLVMVISLTRQLANAQGDLARTIESPSNQLKILSEQLDRLKIAIGNVLTIFVGQALPYINGFIMALVELTNHLATFLRQLLGIKEDEDNFDYSGLGKTSDTVDDLIDGMAEANKEVEKLKKNLIGIDELNILEPQEETATDNLIDPTIMNAFNAALKDWDNRMDEVNMKAYQIRDAILSFIGLKPEDDGSWGLKEGASLARSIQEVLTSIDLTNLLDDFTKLIELITAGYLALLAWKIALNPFIWIIAGIYKIWTSLNKALDDGYTWLDMYADTLLGISMIIAGIALLFKSWTLGAIAIILFGIYKIVQGISDIVRDGIADWKDMKKIMLGIAIILATFGVITKNWVLLAIAGVALLFNVSLNQLVGFGNRLKNGTTTFFDWVAITFAALLISIITVIESALKIILSAILVVVEIIGDAIFLVILATVAAIEAVLAPIILALQGIAKVYDAIKGTNISSKIQTFAQTKAIWNQMISWDKKLTDTKNQVWSDSLAQRMNESVFSAMTSEPEQVDDSKTKELWGQFEKLMQNMNSYEKQTNITMSASLDEQEKQTAISSSSNKILGDIASVYDNMSTEERQKLISGNVYATKNYASGGYPNKGMFVMNEGSSTEMLGSINGRTAVVNNNEIASALAQALAPMLGSVVTAVENVASNDRPIILNVDSRQVARTNTIGNQKLGYNQIGGEFANV